MQFPSLSPEAGSTLLFYRQAQYHRREISNIVRRHQELLHAPEATYVPKDRQVPWRMQKARQQADEALHADEAESLDQEELEVYQQAYAAAKSRYATENAQAYTSAYDRAKESHESVRPERRLWGPGDGMISFNRHPLATELTGRPGSRSPSPARPGPIPSLSREAVQWKVPAGACEAMSPETKAAVFSVSRNLDRNVFDIAEARFAREGEWVPRSPEGLAAVSFDRPATGSWRDYL
jgi:hypothetical protein